MGARAHFFAKFGRNALLSDPILVPEGEMLMKKYVPLILVIAALYVGLGKFNGTPTPDFQTPATSGHEAVASAFRAQRSGVQVKGEGIVTKILRDDDDGSRHQRFILSLGSGQTLLVAHNIDLAPRLTGLKAGDTVAFNGVYEWNSKGGVIHWTHHDPRGQHEPGWLKYDGQTFQ